MEHPLLFGAAYYPEYLPNDRVDADLAMMKAAGMNVLRIAESTWSTLEPTPGVFDFSYIDRVLSAATDAGMGVIIGTPTYAVPSWLIREDPAVMVTAPDGAGLRLYGPRQCMDITNPTFRRRAEEVIRALAAHAAPHPAVIGFQVDNETKHYGTASPAVQAAFKRTLMARFGTTEAFNRAFGLAYWSNAIARWDDLPDLRGTVHAGLAGAFDAFRRTLAAQYLQWQADLLAEYCRPDQFVTHNFDFEWRKFGAAVAQDGYSYGVQPGINHREASAALTLCGTDIYHPSQDELTGAEIAYCGDSIRCLQHKPYLVLETQAQAFKNWTPFPGQLRLQAYSHLASGACGTLYWNWHSIHNGFETYWKGLLSHDLAPNPTYREACRIGAEWQKLSPVLSGLTKQNEIAVVVDNRSLDALRWFPIDKDLSYNDVVRWMYDSLYELGYECDVVDAQALDPRQYRMVVTPALYCADAPLLEALKEYVAAGGVLVSSFKSFVANTDCTVWPEALPARMTDCFGMSYSQYTAPGTAAVQGRPARLFAELLTPNGAKTLAAYEHKYWGAYAAMTRHAYGRGAAWYIGCYTDKAVLKNLLTGAAADAGLAEPVARWPVTVRTARAADGRALHFVLHYSQQEETLPCPWAEAADLLTGETFRRGQPMPLTDWAVRILAEPDVARPEHT